jgi:hypothetical protein
MKTWMKKPHRLAVQGFELLSKQSLMEPNGLKQSFGRRIAVFVQNRSHAATDAPMRVRALQIRGHLCASCVGGAGKVKRIVSYFFRKLTAQPFWLLEMFNSQIPYSLQQPSWPMCLQPESGFASFRSVPVHLDNEPRPRLTGLYSDEE